MSTPSAAADPLVGALLGGRYRLQGVIGHGASGRVYRAMQEPMGREVAVKLMHPPTDPEGAHDLQARFLREAALAGRIQHPHVVTVHDYGRTETGECFIVMEHLRGRTLRALLMEGALPVPRALRITEQLLRGLRAAHQAGLVHRDVKPSNVILLRADDGGDFVKLFDFGLVKGDDEATITHVGTFVGTPQYVAPEQARAELSDPRSDLYSVGVILYRMLTGVLPYTADNPLAVAWMHVREALPAMAERAPEVQVPPEVEGLVRSLMEKTLEARPADADAALEALARVRQALGLPEVEGRPVPPGEDTLRVPIPPPELRSAEVRSAEVRSADLRSSKVQAVDDLADEVRAGPMRAGRRWMLAGGLAVAVGLAAMVGLATGARALLRAPGGGLAVEDAAGEDAAGEDAAGEDAAGEGTSAEAAPGVELAAGELAGGELAAGELAAGEPSTEPAPPAPPREATILISSEPSGAEVFLGELSLGRTPLARSLAVLEGEGGPQPFRLALPGHRGAEVVLDLDQPTAAGHARLSPLPGAGTTAAGGTRATAGGGALVADEVRFSAAEAAAALTWLNEADADALRASGIAARQVNIILDSRPFPDLATFALTPYIGTKTLERVKVVSAP